MKFNLLVTILLLCTINIFSQINTNLILKIERFKSGNVDETNALKFRKKLEKMNVENYMNVNNKNDINNFNFTIIHYDSLVLVKRQTPAYIIYKSKKKSPIVIYNFGDSFFDFDTKKSYKIICNTDADLKKWQAFINPNTIIY